jgi:hypothetical protein
MRTQLIVAAALFAVTPLAGCASIVSGTKSEFRADCPTCKADVTIVDGYTHKPVFTGTTPAAVKLKRGAGFFKPAKYTVTISKDGYAPVTHPIEGGINGWYIGGNFFFGGLIGWVIVDPLTGAMWTLERSFTTELAPLSSASAGDGKDLTIISRDAVPPNLQRQMRPVQ